MIQLYQEIIKLMIECSDTSELGSFFMDTYFATSKAEKFPRGNTCCQIFVSYKVFVFVVPIKSKSEVPLAFKLFAK